MLGQPPVSPEKKSPHFTDGETEAQRGTTRQRPHPWGRTGLLAICDDPLLPSVLGDPSHSPRGPSLQCPALLPPSCRHKPLTDSLYPFSRGSFSSPQEDFPGQVRVGRRMRRQEDRCGQASPFRVPPEGLRCSSKAQTLLCLGPGFRLSEPRTRRPGAGTQIHFLPGPERTCSQPSPHLLLLPPPPALVSVPFPAGTPRGSLIF